VGSDDPGAAAVVGDRTLTACTWELAVIGFERDAWVDALGTRPPDTGRCLAEQLVADV